MREILAAVVLYRPQLCAPTYVYHCDVALSSNGCQWLSVVSWAPRFDQTLDGLYNSVYLSLKESAYAVIRIIKKRPKRRENSA